MSLRLLTKICATRLRLFLLLIVIALAVILPWISQAARQSLGTLQTTETEKRPQSVAGEILIRFRSDAPEAKATPKRGERKTFSILSEGRQISIQLERLTDGPEIVEGLRLAHVTPADTEVVIAALLARPDVAYAEPNFLRFPQIVPNDPQYGQQWALKNTGQTGGVVGADIKAEPAWDISTGSRSIVVGVVDSGIDINHPDLKDNIWINPAEIPGNGIDDDGNGFVDDINGWDFFHHDNTVFDGNGTFPADQTDAHGTHVAGTIGATGNNGVGIAGVNWQVSIMALKFLGPGGGTSADLLTALAYAKNMRDLWVSTGGAKGANLRVLNNSYGGSGFSQTELDAIKALNNSGILFIAAAGNSSLDSFNYPAYPANYDSPNVIAVASTTNADGLSSFSNSGRNVTMGAPGSSILSTTPNNTYSQFSGTSMAAPHVSGAAALVIAAKPDVSLARLIGVLSYSGDQLSSLQAVTRTGRRLNVFKSILSAQENDSTAPSVPGGFNATPTGGRTFSTTWTAPGDDGSSGTAADYDLFFTGSEANAVPLLLPSQVIPLVAGTQQSASVTIPYRHSTGTITLRSFDNSGNFSDVTAPVNLSPGASTDPYQQSFGPAGGLSTGGSKLLNADSTVFQGDDKYRSSYSLPFGFPFFGQTRNQVTISTNGAIYFSTPLTFPNGDAADGGSSIEALRGQVMLAGLWDDLVLNTSVRPNDGVYIVRPDANGIIFRWQGATFNGSFPVNFEMELRSDGSVAFRYGDGNTGLRPVVGLSGGEPDAYVVDAYTSKSVLATLTNAQAAIFIPFGGGPFPSPSPSPSPTPTATPSPTPTPSPGPGGIRQISLTTKDLVYDPFTQRIYASVPSSAVNGNSITRIDPFAGTVGTSVFIGSEPGKLAISNNSQYIYAALDGAAAVRRFDVAAQTAGLQFALGSDSFFGPLYVDDMAVVPGQPDALAVSRRYQGVSPRHAGVGIYDVGIIRSTTTPTHTGADVIEFSSSASTLYGYNNETTEFGFRKMTVSPSGVTVTTTTSNIISGFGVDIVYDNGLVYATTGQVVNPELGVQVGSFPGLSFPSLVLPDSAANRVYFLTGSGSSTLTLKAFNQTTFIQTGSLSITGVSGTPGSLIKWGADGIAFRTSGNQIFLISTSAIVPINPSPAPTPIQVAPGIVKLPLATNDLVYDGNSQTVYASVPSSAGSFGNSIAPINPQTGIMGNAVLVGSEPRKLAIAGNGQYIYAGLDGSASVRRFDVASQTAGLQFAVGASQFNGPMYVEDMAVMPNNPNSVAISRRNTGFSPKHEGVGIYDDGVVRSVTTPGHTGSNVIEYSSTASTLYGYNNETTDFGFRKMTVSSSGVSTVATFSNVIGGFGVDIHYENGLVYSTTGRVLNPETGALLGTFSGASGPVVADASVGRVYYLTGGSGSLTLKEYDVSTLAQTGSLVIPGVSSTPASLIKCGSNGLAFRADNQVFFILRSAIIPIPPTPVPTPTQLANGVIRLPLATNDLVYDPNTNRVYASLPASAGSFGNSIAPLNPQTGTMGTPVLVGSDPRKLAISSNGQYIYAGLDGSAAVRRFSVATQTAGLQFSLGSGQSTGALYVDDLAVMPNNPNTVAISRRNQGFSPRHEGVAIYDDGVMRAVTTPSHTGSNVIEYSSSASTLYGQNNETTEFGFRKMTVSASGVTVTSTVTNLFSGGDIKYDNGRVYGSSGRVIDPEAGTLLGTFANVNSIAFQPDSSAGRIYFVTGSDSNTVLRVFDLNTFLPIGSFNISGVNGNPGSLVRWGSGGLAFRTSGNQVFFLQLSQLPGPISNPVDDARNFVRQNYLDFLSREPDQAGWDYWTGQITQCNGNQLCINSRRIEVSAAFFIELEFQQTGSVVYRLYRAAYGTLAGSPARAKVSFAEFIADRAQLVGGSGLPQSTIDLANNFVQRSAFKTEYPDALSNADFVNHLFDKAGLTGATNDALRQTEISAMTNGRTRAQVLLDVIEIQEFKDREYNPSFVLMQYFGYLRRDADQGGYDFWLNILNNRLPQDPSGYRAMVCAFITSTEYQLRFGTSITRTNQDCSQ